MLIIQRLVKLKYFCKAREKLQEQREKTIVSQKRSRDIKKKRAKENRI